MSEEEEKKEEKPKKKSKKWIYIIVGSVLGLQLLILGLLTFMKIITMKAFIISEVGVISATGIAWIIIFAISKSKQTTTKQQFNFETKKAEAEKGKQFCKEYLYTNPDYLIRTDPRNTDHTVRKEGKEGQKIPILLYDTRNYRDWNEKIVMILNLANYKEHSVKIKKPMETDAEFTNRIELAIMKMAETTTYIPERVTVTTSETGAEVKKYEPLPMFPEVEKESVMGEKPQ